MGWGTNFNIDIYLNRQIFSSKYEVEDKILELTKNIEDNKSKLKMYASSTPNDIKSDDCDNIIDCISYDIDFIFNSIEEDLKNLFQLRLYSEYIEEHPIISKNTPKETNFTKEEFSDDWT